MRRWIRSTSIGFVNPLVFLAVSIPLFLLWDAVVRDGYLRFLGDTFTAIARGLGQPLDVVGIHDGRMEFTTGETGWINEYGMTVINLVPYVGLVAATMGIGWARRLRMAVAGIVVLVVLHVAGLGCDLLNYRVHEHPAWLRFADGLRALFTGFGTFLFPVLLWLLLLRDRLAGVATRLAAAERPSARG